MKRIAGFFIGVILALFLLVNVDRISHPRDIMGTWKCGNGVVVYTFSKYGKGTYSKNKEETWDSFTWYKSGNNIVVNTFDKGNVNVEIQTDSNQVTLYHPGYKDSYNKLKKKEDTKEEKDFYDVFEAVCEFLTIKIPEKG